jgi:type I restriction enzyme, S subunit
MVDLETGTVTTDANRGLPRQSELPKLPDGWCWKRFDAVCERVSVGHVGPTTEFFCENGSGIPLIRSQDVRPGRLMLDSAAHITPEFHAKLRKSQLKAGDVLIVRVGANRSDSCVVPKDAPPALNCANIVFARPHEPNGFFGFFFRSAFGRSLLISATTGAAQGVINTHSVAAMPVPVPPLSIHAESRISCQRMTS